jgi:hypothetical protein
MHSLAKSLISYLQKMKFHDIVWIEMEIDIVDIAETVTTMRILHED